MVVNGEFMCKISHKLGFRVSDCGSIKASWVRVSVRVSCLVLWGRQFSVGRLTL